MGLVWLLVGCGGLLVGCLWVVVVLGGLGWALVVWFDWPVVGLAECVVWRVGVFLGGFFAVFVDSFVLVFYGYCFFGVLVSL